MLHVGPLSGNDGCADAEFPMGPAARAECGFR